MTMMLDSRLYFITGNHNKLREAQAIIATINGLNLDLAEIQSNDPRMIIEAKLQVARPHRKVLEQNLKEEGYDGSIALFCEDTSLHISVLNGFPGPNIKWFLETLRPQGIYDAVHGMNLVRGISDYRALARTIIGYDDGVEIQYFEGVMEGTVVAPRGITQFGWDQIFEPDGYTLSYAQMDSALKNKVSMRREALEKMRDYLITLDKKL